LRICYPGADPRAPAAAGPSSEICSSPPALSCASPAPAVSLAFPSSSFNTTCADPGRPDRDMVLQLKPVAADDGIDGARVSCTAFGAGFTSQACGATFGPCCARAERVCVLGGKAARWSAQCERALRWRCRGARLMPRTFSSVDDCAETEPSFDSVAQPPCPCATTLFCHWRHDQSSNDAIRALLTTVAAHGQLHDDRVKMTLRRYLHKLSSFSAS